jgi:hypothetical protein
LTVHRVIKTYWGSGWSAELYYFEDEFGTMVSPKKFIDDVEGWIYLPMCLEQGLHLYYRVEL